MADQSNGTTWYWLRPDREQVRGSLGELKALLAARALPRSTLVWVEPWPEWLPATEVAALASALPPSVHRLTRETLSGIGSAAAAAAARKSEPPAARKSEPPAAREAPKGAGAGAPSKSAAPAVAASPPPGPVRAPTSAPEPVSPGVAASVERRPVVLPESTAAAGTPAEPPALAALVVVPPAAVEPATSAASKPLADASGSHAAAETPSPKEAPRVEPAAATRAPSRPVVAAAAPAAVPAPSAQTAPPRSAETAPPAARSEMPTRPELRGGAQSTASSIPHRRLSTTSEAPVELLAEPSEVPPASGAGPKKRAKVALVAVSVACAGLALALGLTLRQLTKRPVAVAAHASVPAPKPPEPGCTLLEPAAKFASSVQRDVAISVAALDATRAAIGFAATPAEAQGIVVDLGSLDVARPFVETAERRIGSVIAKAGDAASFSVERDDAGFTSARVLETNPPVTLGVTAEGLMARAGSGAALRLLALSKGQATEPRAARLADGSHAVALRRGGAAGEIHAGFLGPDGHAEGELGEIVAGAHLIGAPSVAANAGRALVAFAARDGDSDPWKLRLATLRPNQGADAARDFAVPTNEVGNGAIAPSVSALDDARWLVQWTQGEVGHYRVFVQAVGADLAPQGAAVPVSPMGANAGQGTVLRIGERTLSLFVLPVPGRDELWGAVLKCQ